MTSRPPLTAPGRRLKRARLLKGSAVGVVGTGQIGGSLLLALGVHRQAIRLLAFDTETQLARRVRRHAAWCRSLTDLVVSCDLIVLAVPVQEVIRLLPQIGRAAAARRARPRLVVCDTATVKTRVIAAAAAHADAFDFVGAHPLAGTERSGWEGAGPGLFTGRAVVICPAGRRATALARELFSLAGGVPVPMAADEHDLRAATGIGLPHVLAFAAAAQSGRQARGPSLQGGSWNSLTRVSQSSPAMVAGFLHANAVHQRRALDTLRARLEIVDRLLRSGSLAGLARQLQKWQAAAAPARPRD